MTGGNINHDLKKQTMYPNHQIASIFLELLFYKCVCL